MAKFVSNQKGFSHFLEMLPSGGKWAEFTNGEYETKNEAHAEKLRNAPNFGIDFYEVGRRKEQPKVAIGSGESGDLFKCPVCGKTESKKGAPFNTAQRAQLHCRMEHKKQYTQKDIEKVA